MNYIKYQAAERKYVVKLNEKLNENRNKTRYACQFASALRASRTYFCAAPEDPQLVELSAASRPFFARPPGIRVLVN